MIRFAGLEWVSSDVGTMIFCLSVHSVFLHFVFVSSFFAGSVSLGRLNNLYGQIPSELGKLTEMLWFEIQDDYLVGTIPDSLGTGWTNLHTFLVGGNFLTGGFPMTFENNELLGTVFIDRNRFNGTFPSVFASLKNLKWLDAESNTFVGEMPAEIGNLKSLSEFLFALCSCLIR